MYFNAIRENKILAKIFESSVSIMFKSDTSCHSFPELAAYTVKPVLSGHPPKEDKIVFQDRLLHNAGKNITGISTFI